MTTDNQRVFPLTEIEVESAVNDAGEAFIIVRARGTMRGEPMVCVGHIDTQTARMQGMTFIEAAEAAESDAALYGFTLETADDGAPAEAVKSRAAAFIGALRQYRARRDNDVIDGQIEEVEVGGLLKVGNNYYRAPSTPSPIGFTRHDTETDWFPIDGAGNALLMVESPDPTEAAEAIELTPPPSEAG